MPVPNQPAYPGPAGYGQSMYPQGGNSPYGQGGQYNPFDPTYLYAPMAQEIEAQNQAQMGQLREQFGSQGGRWSSGLANAQATGLAKTAADKAKLLSGLMYQGAQDTYGRQKDSAQMGMQLGSLQDARDAQMAEMLSKMGLAEKGAATDDLMRQYQEWLRTSQGYIPDILGAGMRGYQTDMLKDPGFWEKYGGYFQAAGNAAANYNW